MSDLRILVTNDDGINAPGLETLERIAAQLSDDVIVVAPEVNQSGASHSLTMRHPLRVRRLGERRFAVDGTPTDCVLLALQAIIKDRPIDLVLSGVNHGGNLGEDVTYSGTVAAAMEATLFNIRAIALSQSCRPRDPVKWDTAEAHGALLIRRIIEVDWAPDVLINVNFPDRIPSAVQGVRVVAQGKRKLGDVIVERVDPRGEPYIWIGGLREESLHKDGTDLAAIHKGFISVTPIHMDMTHHDSFDDLRKALE